MPKQDKTEQEWLQAVYQLAVATIHPDNPIEFARQLLLDSYWLALDAPQDVIIRFGAYSEADIAGLADALIERAHHGDFSFNVPEGVSIQDGFLALAVRIRALDAFLMQTRRDYGDSSDPGGTWLVKTASNEGFLIPRSVPRRASLRSKKRDDLGAFVHRGMLWHRALPLSVGGYRVGLFPAQVHIQRGESDGMKLGAALFGDLKLDVQTTGTTFRITGIECPSGEKAIGDHIAQAHGDECAILAFPELTIGPEQRNRIEADLKFRPWVSSSGAFWTVPLVLAGSWHDVHGSKCQNVATLYDGYGTVIAQHRKLFPYMDPEGRLEDIASGGVLTVIITEDALVAVGVCRDFCERGAKPNPYSLLDVDIFVVASFGNDTTMKGHFATAQDVELRFRAGAFVVQQAATPSPNLAGFVLSPEDPVTPSIAHVKRSQTWNTVTVSAPGVDFRDEV